jgi:2-oxoglutarate dehydrogenase complex dehydrogenase (E1) component-like enzyme
MEAIYSSNIGFEFMHIQNPRVRNWLRERIERRNEWSVDATTKIRMLRHLMKVELFEQFLHTRFMGVKRFSIEGGESLISALDGVLENCPKFKVKSFAWAWLIADGSPSSSNSSRSRTRFFSRSSIRTTSLSRSLAMAT